MNRRSSRTSLGNGSTTSAPALSLGDAASSNLSTPTSALPSPVGPPPLPAKDLYSPSTHHTVVGSLAGPSSPVPPSAVVGITTGSQQREVPSISISRTRTRQDTDSSWASVSPGAGFEFPLSAGANAASSKATSPTLSDLVALEEQQEGEGQTALQSEHDRAAASKKPLQSRFPTVNIFSKVKQRAKSLARPEPVHLESDSTTPGMEKMSGGALPPLPAFLFDPQAEGTSSHAQVHAYGHGTSKSGTASSSGRSKSDQRDIIPVPPSAFRPLSAIITDVGANVGAGAGSGSGGTARTSREYSPYTYRDPRVVGSARLQDALERDVPANTGTNANGDTRPGTHGKRPSQAELQWSQMLFDS